MAGYAGKQLAHKMGLKPGDQFLLIAAPLGYNETIGKLPEGVEVSREPVGKYDLIQAFFKSKRQLEAVVPVLKQHLDESGALWISWPKKAAKIETDIDEAVVMQIGLAAGLVDVKVMAVDAIWSGLKFVYRLRDLVE